MVGGKEGKQHFLDFWCIVASTQTRNNNETEKKRSDANKPKHCARLEGHEKVKKCLLRDFIKINLDYDSFF